MAINRIESIQIVSDEDWDSSCCGDCDALHDKNWMNDYFLGRY